MKEIKKQGVFLSFLEGGNILAYWIEENKVTLSCRHFLKINLNQLQLPVYCGKQRLLLQTKEFASNLTLLNLEDFSNTRLENPKV